MDQDSRRLYNALTARDSRFDGVFFVGVTSTGIYCRPICPAKTPKAANCRFFDTPQEAEQAGFRPVPALPSGTGAGQCAGRRCAAHRAADRAASRGRAASTRRPDSRRSRISSSSARGRSAASSRRSWACPPIQLLLTRRLLLAKQLLTETRCRSPRSRSPAASRACAGSTTPSTTRYGMPPTRLRKTATDDADAIVEGQTSTLQLVVSSAVRLAGRAGVSRRPRARGRRAGDRRRVHAAPCSSARPRAGSSVTQSRKKHALMVEFTHSLTPVLPALLSRVRALFDLECAARPDREASQQGRAAGMPR